MLTPAMRSAWVLFALLVYCSASKVTLRAHSSRMPDGMTVTSCKTICHRMGWKSIGTTLAKAGEQGLGQEFSEMSDAVTCANKCEAMLASQAIPKDVAQTALSQS